MKTQFMYNKNVDIKFSAYDANKSQCNTHCYSHLLYVDHIYPIKL
jgi:hypothetical protein